MDQKGERKRCKTVKGGRKEESVVWWLIMKNRGNEEQRWKTVRETIGGRKCIFLGG